MNTGFLGPAVATVLTVHGIETIEILSILFFFLLSYVATVLTVHGIETVSDSLIGPISKLQQYLPFTVLKPTSKYCLSTIHELQQYLPFTVLKQLLKYKSTAKCMVGCNSTYRSRY